MKVACTLHCFQVLTSAAQAKSRLTAHFECLRQCVNEALSERLAGLQQSVDNVVQESIAPLEQCQQEIQHRVDIAVQTLDTGQCTVDCRISFKLACLTYKLLTISQPAYLHTRYYTITPLHTPCGRLINFSLTCCDFPLNVVKDRVVTWLVQSGMDYLLISDFCPLSTHSNAV